MFSVKSMRGTLLEQGQNGQSEEEADLYLCPLSELMKMHSQPVSSS